MSTIEGYVRPAQVCEQLNVHAVTLRRWRSAAIDGGKVNGKQSWIDEAGLRYIKEGGVCHYSSDDVNKLALIYASKRKVRASWAKNKSTN